MQEYKYERMEDVKEKLFLGGDLFFFFIQKN
jgi:hypothetical protein